VTSAPGGGEAGVPGISGVMTICGPWFLLYFVCLVFSLSCHPEFGRNTHPLFCWARTTHWVSPHPAVPSGPSIPDPTLRSSCAPLPLRRRSPQGPLRASVGRGQVSAPSMQTDANGASCRPTVSLRANIRTCSRNPRCILQTRNIEHFFRNRHFPPQKTGMQRCTHRTKKTRKPPI